MPVPETLLIYQELDVPYLERKDQQAEQLKQAQHA